MLTLWNRLRSWLRAGIALAGDGRDLQSTFDLLNKLIRGLIVLVAVWAVAAGFLQAGRLVEYIPNGLPGRGQGFWASQVNWLAPLLGVPVYAFKAFGVAMLLGLAAAMLGGFLGFLFGLPRLATEPASAGAAAATTAAQPPQPPAGMPPGSATATAASPPPPAPRPMQMPAAAAQTRRSWQASTNLTEISDWLTKIIVGVGLVEAKAIFESLAQLSKSLGAMLFDGAVGSELVIPAVIIAGAVIGFFYWYLFTQLVIAPQLARSDAELGGGGTASYQAIVPRTVQDRKQKFSDYIFDDRNAGKLPEIARRLGVTIDSTVGAAPMRRAILAAVAIRVNIADPAQAAAAMDALSDLLYEVTAEAF